VSAEKHLLVDGSNIMHAWPELRTLLKRDRDTARSRLSLAVAAIHDAGQARVTLVFDGRGSELVVEQPSGHTNLAHVFTPTGTTADDVIEQLVGRAAAPGACVVASDDRAVRSTVEALGAESISAEELANWAARAAARQGAQAAGLRRDNERQWRRPQN
jgi:predicted RNA-binding protein with PIN domain